MRKTLKRTIAIAGCLNILLGTTLLLTLTLNANANENATINTTTTTAAAIQKTPKQLDKPDITIGAHTLKTNAKIRKYPSSNTPLNINETIINTTGKAYQYKKETWAQIIDSNQQRYWVPETHLTRNPTTLDTKECQTTGNAETPTVTTQNTNKNTLTITAVHQETHNHCTRTTITTSETLKPQNALLDKNIIKFDGQLNITKEELADQNIYAVEHPAQLGIVLHTRYATGITTLTTKNNQMIIDHTNTSTTKPNNDTLSIELLKHNPKEKTLIVHGYADTKGLPLQWELRTSEGSIISSGVHPNNNNNLLLQYFTSKLDVDYPNGKYTYKVRTTETINDTWHNQTFTIS